MQTCSNCGAAARPGAKFCTSCGARLPLVQTSESAGWGNNGDQSPWGSTPANGHGETEPASVTASAASDQPPAERATTSGGAASPLGQSGGSAAQGGTSDADSASMSGSSGSASSWSWGQPQADDTPSSDTAPSTDDEPKTSGNDAPATSQPNWISSWTGPGSDTGASDQDASGSVPAETAPPASAAETSGWSSPSSDTATTGDEASASEPQETQQATENVDPDARPEWMRNLTAGSQETVADTVPEQTSADFFSDTTETVADRAPASSEDTASADVTAPAWSSSDQPGTATSDAESGSAQPADVTATAAPADTGAAAADDAGDASVVAAGAAPPTSAGAASVPAAAGTATSTDGSSTNALSEAQGLLDRLRELLPTLAAPTPAGRDTSGVANQLQQALDQNAKPEFDDLRSVLEAAKDRPRDVDTMLNLVAKIDPMLDLLHAHGNLLTAIGTAVTQLRDGNGGQ